MGTSDADRVELASIPFFVNSLDAPSFSDGVDHARDVAFDPPQAPSRKPSGADWEVPPFVLPIGPVESVRKRSASSMSSSVGDDMETDEPGGRRFFRCHGSST